MARPPQSTSASTGLLILALLNNVVQAVRRTAVHKVSATFMSPEVRATIHQNMTIDKAVSMLKHLDNAPPNLVNFVEGRIGNKVNASGKGDPTGYGGVAAATNMLNDMIKTASTKKDIETVRCEEYHKTQTRLIEDTREQIAKFDAEAAQAREEILRADAQIDMITDRLDEAKDKLTMNERMCEEAIPNLENQLRIVNGDLAVMAKVLEKN